MTKIDQADLAAFDDLLLKWSTKGDNPYVLEEGGLPDREYLAQQALQWAEKILLRSQPAQLLHQVRDGERFADEGK